jgi:cytochrome c oxidase cbb3-type subunit 3
MPVPAEDQMRMRRPSAIALALAAAVALAATTGAAGRQPPAATTGAGTPQAPTTQAPVPPPPGDLTQQPPQHGAQPAEPPGEQPPAPFPAHQRPPAPPAVLERGRAMYMSMCSTCHGADARGGQLGGVNLLRSPIMLGDRDGELVLPIVKNGRPGTAMMAIPMLDADVKAVTAYVHSLQAQGDVQGGPPPGPPVPLNILVGDATAGASYFSRTCASCHSATGDLAGIGSRVADPKTLQNLWVSGGRVAGHGPGRRARTAEDAPAVKVTLPDGIVQGRLVRLDDFLVTVLLDDGTTRSIRRRGDTPAVEITDPLARHTELLAKYSDQDIHDVTAYLSSLK